MLRTPKGWTGPVEVDGLPMEGTWRAHQVPLAEVRTNADHLAALEAWMRSYRPEELFDARGRPRPDVVALSPAGTRRMGANPHANGGRLLCELALLDFRNYVAGLIGRVPFFVLSAAPGRPPCPPGGVPESSSRSDIGHE